MALSALHYPGKNFSGAQRRLLKQIGSVQKMIFQSTKKVLFFVDLLQTFAHGIRYIPNVPTSQISASYAVK